MRAKKSVSRITFTIVVLSIAIFAFYVSPVLAQDPSAGGLVPCGGATDPCTLCHFVIGLHKLVRYGMYVIMALAALSIFFAGVAYIFSSGSESLMTTAKGFLKGSLIGFTVVFGGWLIITTALWILSAQGDLGIGKTGGWATFTCNTGSSALVEPPPPAPPNSEINPTPGSSNPPGTPGGACGNNLIGRCLVATQQSGSNAFTVCSDMGKMWVSGGINCPTAYYCCADYITQGGGCEGVEADGTRKQGTCQPITGTGGVGVTESNVCPNRSWKIAQVTGGYEPLCASGLGCCDMSSSNANTAQGILDAPCGPTGSNATCQRGTLTNPCPFGTSNISGGTSCGTGLWCCGTSTGSGTVPPGPEPGITP